MEKILALLQKVVTKTNDPFEEKLQIENNIKREINEIRVKLNNFKMQNGLDLANLKGTVSNIEEGKHSSPVITHVRKREQRN